MGIAFWLTGWHPKGLLVAHLHEHKSAVNRIRVSDEHSIFATCSNDGTVKIWDSQKMEGKTTTTRYRVTIVLKTKQNPLQSKKARVSTESRGMGPRMQLFCNAETYPMCCFITYNSSECCSAIWLHSRQLEICLIP